MVTALLVFAAISGATACVMAFRRPRTIVRVERSFAPPPVTMEHRALRPAPGLVPQIDRSVLAALAASGSRLARGSIPPAADELATDLDDSAATLRGDDLDEAETLRPSQDLDESATTRADMQRVN